MGIVIALSGALGSRRSDLADRLAARLAWPKVKFSDYIRIRIEQDGAESDNRLLQQSYGQQLVQFHLEQFVDGVLEMADWRGAGNLIVDGLRHVEVLVMLRQKVQPSRLLYVNVKADAIEREDGAKLRGIEEQNLYRFDRDLTEAQIGRILPAYSDLELEVANGFTLNVEAIVRRLQQMDPQLVQN